MHIYIYIYIWMYVSMYVWHCMYVQVPTWHRPLRIYWRKIVIPDDNYIPRELNFIDAFKIWNMNKFLSFRALRLRRSCQHQKFLEWFFKLAQGYCLWVYAWVCVLFHRNCCSIHPFGAQLNHSTLLFKISISFSRFLFFTTWVLCSLTVRQDSGICPCALGLPWHCGQNSW